MSKWIVQSKYVTGEDMKRLFVERGENPDDFNIAEINECEVSVVREDYALGIRSAGWIRANKKFLVSDECSTRKELEESVKQAERICAALNEAEK